MELMVNHHAIAYVYVALWTLDGSHRTIPEATYASFFWLFLLLLLVQSSLIL